MHARHLSFASLAFVLAAACGDKGSSGASTSSATATTTAASTSNAAAASATPAPEKTAEAAAGAEPGSVASLREKATGVMDALKKGDAKAAADFCLGKHRDGLEKYIAETIEKKDQSRSKAYQKWDGKLGEMRVDGDNARVAFGEDGTHVDYLSFRKKNGAWSLDDIPVAQKGQWEKWGKVVTE